MTMKTLYTITATKDGNTKTLENLTAKQVNKVQALGYETMVIDTIKQDTEALYNSTENTYTM